MRWMLWGTYQRGYARNRILERALQLNGCNLIIRHAPVWEQTRDKPRAYRRPLHKARLILQLLNAWTRLLLQSYPLRRCDALLCGFIGHFDVLPARLLCWLWRKPLVFDAFISLHDTAVHDRQLLHPRSLLAQLLRLVDLAALRLADVVIADTQAHADFYADRFRVPPERLLVLPVGADDQLYTPRPEIPPEPGRILHYGTFAPLHGADVIVEAARQLASRAPQLRFVIIGDGQQRAAAEAQAAGLPNVELRDPLPEPALAAEIARAELCLGIFGRSDKARRVVPNKVYQALACGRPILTAAGPGVTEALADVVATCPPGDPAALAEAILALHRDPERRRALATAGRTRYLEAFSPARLGEALVGALRASRWRMRRSRSVS